MKEISTKEANGAEVVAMATRQSPFGFPEPERAALSPVPVFILIKDFSAELPVLRHGISERPDS